MAVAVDKSRVPWWVSNLIVPLVNLILALLVSALFIFIAGENPVQAVKLIIYGSSVTLMVLHTLFIIQQTLFLLA